MNKPLRLIVGVSLAGAALLAGLAWPAAIMQNVVVPVATVLWLLLRLFVLSIDQQVYWWCAITAAAVVLVVLLVWRPWIGEYTVPTVPALPGDPARRWRNSLLLNWRSEPRQDTFRRDLAWMLTALYASERPGFARYQVREALRDRRIPLPEPVYEFLFAAVQPPDPWPPLLRHPRAWLLMAKEAAAVSLRGVTGKARRESDYFESIAAVLAFMETSLEMNHELTPDP